MKFFTNVILIVGVLILAQGFIAFYWRLNILTGTRYGPSLMPIYIIFSGVGVCLIGLALRVVSGREKTNNLPQQKIDP